MKYKIKTIIFDYAGVITPTKGFLKFANKYHRKFNLTSQELYDLLRKDWDATKINQLPAYQYWNNAADVLNIKADKLKEYVLATFPIDIQIIKLIEKLKADYKIVLLSNQIEDWLEEVISKNNLNNYFDHIITSYNTRFSKPDKRIYEIVKNKTNSKYSECLLIDDLAENVETATELGMQGIVYKNFTSLIKDLKSLQIKI